MVAAVLFCFIQANGGHLEVMAGAANLPPNAIPDIITGYMDGLLGVSLKGQLDHCDYFITHAKETFEEAIDLIYQCEDFWLPITKKFDLFNQALMKMLRITTQVI